MCVKMGSRHSVLGAGDQRERLSQVTHRRSRHFVHTDELNSVSCALILNLLDTK